MVEAHLVPERGTLVYTSDGRKGSKITMLNGFRCEFHRLAFFKSFVCNELLAKMIKDFRIIVFYRQIVAYFRTLD